jgi:hypothetical protein
MFPISLTFPKLAKAGIGGEALLFEARPASEPSGMDVRAYF